ncbi:MAG: hypothetical protein ACRD82_12665, partial [Blastocatellia bacterium]
MASWSKDRILPIESLPNWWDQVAAWQKLTFGGELFEHLRQCVQRRDTGELQQILSDLQTIQEAVSYQPSGDCQSGKAQALVRLAIEAAGQSLPDKVKSLLPPEAQRTLRECLSASAENLCAWEWDVICEWCSVPREALPDTTHRISVLLDETGEGCVAVLDVELIGGGNGEIYPDPCSNGFVEFDKDIKPDEDKFLAAAAIEWNRAKQDVALNLDEKKELEKTDARFRLRRLTEDTRPLLAINGRSAQAAFYLILRQAAKAFLKQTETILLDQSIAVTATVEDLRRLG